jgi:hypothetical protein
LECHADCIFITRLFYSALRQIRYVAKAASTQQESIAQKGLSPQVRCVDIYCADLCRTGYSR